MLDLYCAPTPHAQRALLVLEETHTAYQRHNVDLLKNEQTSPELLELNLLGAVPVLVDSSGFNGRRLVLTQSVAIMLYVAEHSGALIPANAQRRFEMFKWLMLAASDIGGTNTAINQLTRSAPEKSSANVAFFERRLLRYFGACDAHLAEHDYFAGELSIADLCVYPFVVARRSLIGNDLPHLGRWAQQIGSRAAVARAMAV